MRQRIGELVEAREQFPHEVTPGSTRRQAQQATEQAEQAAQEAAQADVEARAGYWWAARAHRENAAQHEHTAQERLGDESWHREWAAQERQEARQDDLDARGDASQ
ncbi:hypothetical protein Pta02_43920 [Planobispora takensis]|uniref:Uncharacterized protein n=1 Tax=Planobispora takensis TaxID=1367882 RepID=A0A8J3SXE5_9ACTN|nr:hypothetical protein Pta02_43920 [Planobispora takensis]